MPLRSLAKWHSVAAGLHGVLFAVVVIWFTVNGTWAAGDVPLSRPSATGYKEGDMAFYEPSVASAGNLPGVPLLAAICCITCLAHVGYARSAKQGSAGRYGAWARLGHNPVRYIEYGVTASLMVLIIASLSGVRDVGALLMLLVATMATMAFGAMGERAFALQVGQPRLAWAGGLVLQAAVWAVIAYAFFTTTSELDDEPDWLPLIFWTQLACFCVFPLIQMLYTTGSITFGTAEKAYVLASFSAKTVLAVLLLSAFVVAE